MSAALRPNAVHTWPGWAGSAISQASVMSYWFLARHDYGRLKELLASSNAANEPAWQLIAAKCDRGIVFDPDQMPSDIVTIGAHVAFRFRNQLEQCVLADPSDPAPAPGSVSVASPLGALLFGMIQGRALRGQDPDGASFTLTVEKVKQPQALTQANAA